MRPPDITDEDISEWEASRQKYLLDHGHELLREPPPDMYYAGEWLYKQLKSLNCPKELNEQICFAAGQRQAYAKDYWQTVVTSFDNYKKGLWEIPGPELAAKLFHEYYGDNPNPTDVLNSQIDAGLDQEKLLALLMKTKMDRIKFTTRKSGV